MRQIILALFIAATGLGVEACSTPASFVSHDHVMDVARRISADYAQSWNSNDRARFGALFAPDARYVNLNGQFLRGRSQIVATHWSTRASYPAGVRMATRLEGARAVTGDTIVAVMRMEQVNMPNAPDGIQAARLTLTLAHHTGGWVIAQAQASQPN